MPMVQALPNPNARKNIRLVPIPPEVKSAKTRDLFNAGVRGISGIEKSADPSCYDVCVG